MYTLCWRSLEVAARLLAEEANFEVKNANFLCAPGRSPQGRSSVRINNMSQPNFIDTCWAERLLNLRVLEPEFILPKNLLLRESGVLLSHARKRHHHLEAIMRIYTVWPLFCSTGACGSHATLATQSHEHECFEKHRSRRSGRSHARPGERKQAAHD